MSGEKRTLVTSFWKLKVSDLVAVTPCRYCGGEHRYLLIKYADDWIDPETWEEFSGFSATPEGSCSDQGYPDAITPGHVSSGRVYLIDPFAEQTDATETAAPGELETVR